MRPPKDCGVAAPSSSLLQFLRSQAEGLCFIPQRQQSSVALRPRRIQVCKTSSRTFTTSPRQNATLESSLLNLDFLSPRSSRLRFPSLPSSPARPGIIIRHRSQDWGSPQRWASSDNRHWLQRLADYRGKSVEMVALRKDDLPPPLLGEPNGNTIFGRSKATNELKLRCTEFDENGNVTLVNGEVKKSELIAKYGLLPRDLRKIDSSLLPSILVRPFAILINLLHLRVLIKHNQVLVFDAYGSTNSQSQSVFMYDLEGKLMQKEASRAIAGGGLPYEFRALEAVLISVMSCLEAEYEGIREPVSKVLKELEEDIDRDKLRNLLLWSKKLGTFEQKARLVRDAIDSILDEDEDLSAMYLSEQAQGLEREEADHTEIEMLLESYHKVCDEIVQNSGNLVNEIRNTEELIKAILDANRNALMLLDLKFSIGTLGIGSGAFIAALYGMNLKNFIEESDLGFWGISGFSSVLTAIVCVYGMRKLRKVQRVSMWGSQGERGNWAEVDNTGSTAGLKGEGRVERLKRLKEVKHLKEHKRVWGEGKC